MAAVTEGNVFISLTPRRLYHPTRDMCVSASSLSNLFGTDSLASSDVSAIENGPRRGYLLFTRPTTPWLPASLEITGAEPQTFVLSVFSLFRSVHLI
jgi:hypothetical protein